MICILDPTAILTRSAAFKRSAHPHLFYQPKLTRMASYHYAQGSGLFFPKYPDQSFIIPKSTQDSKSGDEWAPIKLNDSLLLTTHESKKGCTSLHLSSTLQQYTTDSDKKKSFNVASRLLHQQQLEKVKFLSVHLRKKIFFFSVFLSLEMIYKCSIRYCFEFLHTKFIFSFSTDVVYLQSQPSFRASTWSSRKCWLDLWCILKSHIKTQCLIFGVLQRCSKMFF